MDLLLYIFKITSLVSEHGGGGWDVNDPHRHGLIGELADFTSHMSDMTLRE